MVDLTTPQPLTAEIYYSTCDKIDRHNRCRQKFLDIKKRLSSKDWLKRFNLSVFLKYMVDVWLVYQDITRTENTKYDFYNYLS